MYHPQVDPRTRGDILREIEGMAPYYTPEWRYQPDHPDAGTALSFIWADMLAGTIGRLNETLENHKLALLEALKPESRPALRAGGYISFTVSPDSQDILIPRGTAITAKEDATLQMETTADLNIFPASVTHVAAVCPERNLYSLIVKRENIKLFSFTERCERCWTLNHPFAFDIGDGGHLTLKIDCNGDLQNTLAILGDPSSTQWDFQAGGEWHPILTCEVNELGLRFGSPSLSGCTALRFNLGCPTDAEVRGFNIFPANCNILPEIIYAKGNIPFESAFYPFGTSYMVFDELNISCREALSKPGAMVELSFDWKCEALVLEGEPAPEINWKNIMRGKDVVPPDEYEISISGVSWEYFNGKGWAPLPLEGTEHRTIFTDKAVDAPVNATLRFRCPGDIDTILVGAFETYYLRARITGVNNVFRTRGHIFVPRMSNTVFRYWFEEGIKLRDIDTVQCNISERLTSDFFPRRLWYKPFDQTSLFFGFDKPFSYGSILFDMVREYSAPALEWKYYTQSGWQALNCRDESEGFGKSGLLVFSASCQPVLSNILGVNAYWMRAADILGEYVYQDTSRPILRGIWENTVTAEASTPGCASNLPAGQFTNLVKPIFGITAVCNPLANTGGCDAESPSMTAHRASRRFAHLGRAVTRQDFEFLAQEVSPRVIQCKCYSNTDEKGGFSLRDICLVVMTEKCTNSEFISIKKHILTSLLQFCPLGLDSTLHIIQPVYVTLSITVKAYVGEIGTILSVREAVFEHLNCFLDVRTGNADGCGWQIGQLPALPKIRNTLSKIAGVTLIEHVTVSCMVNDTRGAYLADLQSLENNPFVLPESGTHKVIITV